MLTVVTFHRVLPAALRAEYPLGGIVVTPEELDACLSFFRRHYECGTLGEMATCHSLDQDRGRALLAVTFDDGQRDNFVYARPVLESHGLRGSFFVPIEAIDSGKPLWHDRLAFAVQAQARRDLGAVRRTLDLAGATSPAGAARQAVARAKDLQAPAREALIADVQAQAGEDAVPAWDGMMTWEQIREMQRGGHEIGSHSMTHPILPRCDDAELVFEIAESRRVLERQLGKAPETFCYPNGDHDARTVAQVDAAGYRWAVTTKWGLNERGSPRLAMNRCDIDADRTRGRHGALHQPLLAWRLSGLYPGLG